MADALGVQYEGGKIGARYSLARRGDDDALTPRSYGANTYLTAMIATDILRGVERSDMDYERLAAQLHSKLPVDVARERAAKAIAKDGGNIVRDAVPEEQMRQIARGVEANEMKNHLADAATGGMRAGVDYGRIAEQGAQRAKTTVTDAIAGGGGAGGPGVDGTVSTKTGIPGSAGGPGRASNITGEVIYYAGGGGGGGINYGEIIINGGLGGGGNGARNVTVAARKANTLPDGRNEYEAECGVDGLGGDGGGANNISTDYKGRPGGRGTVIIRVKKHLGLIMYLR